MTMYTFTTEQGRVAAIRRWSDLGDRRAMMYNVTTLASIRRMEQEQQGIRATAAKLIRTNAEVWITDDDEYGFRVRGRDPPL
jgi:hypothetical protein